MNINKPFILVAALAISAVPQSPVFAKKKPTAAATANAEVRPLNNFTDAETVPDNTNAGNNPVQLNNRFHAPKLPKSIAFAGESTPLTRWDVRERLDREILINAYMHGTTLYILKHTKRTFPIIERILRENGVPEDFKFLCAAESALYNQISKAGAVGYWQFLKSSGQQFGLEINDQVDERYDLEKSTQAACRYLKQAYARFGNWTAAAASYNMGMAGYSNYSSQQYESNYYNLLLPEETNRYLYRILALKHILSNPMQYGFILEADDYYYPIKGRTITVNTSISDLAAWAKQNGTTFQQIKLANQWLRGKNLTASGAKTYQILIPG